MRAAIFILFAVLGILAGLHFTFAENGKKGVTVEIMPTPNGYDIYKNGVLIAEYFLPNDSCEVQTLKDVYEFALEIE
jgi:hypothetical protein